MPNQNTGKSYSPEEEWEVVKAFQKGMVAKQIAHLLKMPLWAVYHIRNAFPLFARREED